MDVLSFSFWFFRWLWKRGFPAVEALDFPPTNSRAASFKAAALYFFLVFAGLLLSGSLLHVFGKPMAGEIVSWTGIGCFMIAAYCAVKFASVNGPHNASVNGPRDEDEWEPPAVTGAV
jgi:hypothetical protein